MPTEHANGRSMATQICRPAAGSNGECWRRYRLMKLGDRQGMAEQLKHADGLHTYAHTRLVLVAKGANIAMVLPETMPYAYECPNCCRVRSVHCRSVSVLRHA